ncbi:GNAT family N-acetyltransferase [Singulisphaera sp. GP187]|uniref:GNAT family N-acetyltransferase n=1 Tax=Singulisphaera sp. GP187 TaxID=1882752 RepID=UPI0020B11074|nr:GNAT family N-acetyltransferase [Singulisphaera sp. GP187]
MRPGECRVFGYYSLSSFQIGFETLPTTRSKKLPRYQPIPAALLGRLAVDKSVQGQGLGTVLLVSALGRILSLDREIAIHSVVVHAIDDEARNFYMKQGFEPLLDDPLHLFISMNVIRQLDLAPNDQADAPPPDDSSKPVP